MHDLSGFQRDLLFVVAGRDEPSGIEIKDELEEHYDENIRHGRLYPNLDTLVNSRLIEKGQRDQRTNKYTLSERGKRDIEAYLRWQLEYCPEDVKRNLAPIVSGQQSAQDV